MRKLKLLGALLAVMAIVASSNISPVAAHDWDDDDDDCDWELVWAWTGHDWDLVWAWVCDDDDDHFWFTSGPVWFGDRDDDDWRDKDWRDKDWRDKDWRDKKDWWDK